jgi:hypothetical protein
MGASSVYVVAELTGTERQLKASTRYRRMEVGSESVRYPIAAAKAEI